MKQECVRQLTVEILNWLGVQDQDFDKGRITPATILVSREEINKLGHRLQVVLEQQEQQVKV